MATSKFPFFESYYVSFKEMPPEVIGQVVMAMGAYFFEEIEPDLSGMSKMAFELIRPVMEKTKTISAIRSEAAKGHGAPIGNSNASKNKQNQTKSNKEQTKNKQKQTDKDKDKDKDKDIGLRNMDKEEDKDIEERKDIKEIVELYNSICTSLPRVQKLTPKRRRSLIMRLKTYTVGDLQRAFEKTQASDFLTGKNDRNWTADFDFIINENKLTNILEGKYDNKKPSSIASDWLNA